MKKKYYIFLILLLYNCSINKVVHHHGVHNLEKKQEKLILNKTNKNDIIKLIGPPSTESTFDNDLLIYIEKKTSSTKLSKLGKKELILNNVLVLQVDNKGMLIDKLFYDKDDMKKIDFIKDETTVSYSKRSFIYNFLSSLRQKINDPLGKKRIKD
tara:strand:+ start:102 stop:566 length:465 start_codon:yes stop_codon:yes gene_type:complete